LTLPKRIMAIARQLGPGDKFPNIIYPLSAIALCTFQRIFTETMQSYFFIAASGDRTVFGRSPITRTILKSSNKRISRSWPSPSILWTSRRRYISHWRGLKVPADADQVGAYWEERRGIIHGTGFTVGPDQRILQVLLRHRTDRPNRCSRCLKFDQGSQAQKSTEW
jgi:hypothetical protein